MTCAGPPAGAEREAERPTARLRAALDPIEPDSATPSVDTRGRQEVGVQFPASRDLGPSTASTRSDSCQWRRPPDIPEWRRACVPFLNLTKSSLQRFSSGCCVLS